MKSKPEMIFSLLWRMREGKKKKVRLVLHFCLQKKKGVALTVSTTSTIHFLRLSLFFFSFLSIGVCCRLASGGTEATLVSLVKYRVNQHAGGNLGVEGTRYKLDRE